MTVLDSDSGRRIAGRIAGKVDIGECDPLGPLHLETFDNVWFDDDSTIVRSRLDQAY